MHCLVLAFETMEDLPKNWQDFVSIDAYGQVKVSLDEVKNISTSLHIYNQFFQVDTNQFPNKLYRSCYIKHPDPWGEPRSWMQAIAALGECVDGTLICEFWFPHEIKAFDFLLQSVLGDGVHFVQAKQLPDDRECDTYEAVWQITKKSAEENITKLYQEKEMKILQEFYVKVGPLFENELTLEDV